MKPSSIRKRINNLSGFLGFNGIEIDFEYNGIEEFIELDQDGAIDLMISAGVIEKYKYGVIHFGELFMSWADFVNEECLDENHYLDMIVAYKMRQVCNRINSAA